MGKLLLLLLLLNPALAAEPEESEVYWGEESAGPAPEEVVCDQPKDARESNWNEVFQVGRFLHAVYQPVSDERKSFVCGLSVIADDFNRKVAEERGRVVELVSKLSKNRISGRELQELWHILMRYRLLGANEYFYSMTQYNAREIESRMEEEAGKLAGRGMKPEFCQYFRRSPEKKLVPRKAPLLSPECMNEILQRISPIPTGLALAQATLESGWGTSRFARQGKNLFGIQYRFNTEKEAASRKYCMPAEQDPRRCVYAFESYKDSLYEYFRFLNAGTYQDQFRDHRARELDKAKFGRCEDAARLAAGLSAYAEKKTYQQEISEQVHLVCGAIESCGTGI